METPEKKADENVFPIFAFGSPPASSPLSRSSSPSAQLLTTDRPLRISRTYGRSAAVNPTSDPYLSWLRAVLPSETLNLTEIGQLADGVILGKLLEVFGVPLSKPLSIAARTPEQRLANLASVLESVSCLLPDIGLEPKTLETGSPEFYFGSNADLEDLRFFCDRWCAKYGRRVKDFAESWEDGSPFCVLLHKQKVKPGALAIRKVIKYMQGSERCDLAWDLGLRLFGLPPFLTRPLTERPVVFYVLSFLTLSQFRPHLHLCATVGNWVRGRDFTFHTWREPPKNCLLVLKPNDLPVKVTARKMAKYLKDHGLTIFLPQASHGADPVLARQSQPLPPGDPYETIDFVVSLGGDGTLLHVSSIFARKCPPIVAFSMGSLGFLTPFSVVNFQRELTPFIQAEDIPITVRNRLQATLWRRSGTQTSLIANDVVVTRAGSSLTNLECFCDGDKITVIQADGVCIATSTGSTAYSLSAGGSAVHPDTVHLRIAVSQKSRNACYVSFDGQDALVMEKDITVSSYPLLTATRASSVSDWFSSLADCLNWNVRQEQKEDGVNFVLPSFEDEAEGVIGRKKDRLSQSRREARKSFSGTKGRWAGTGESPPQARPPSGSTSD